LEHFIHRYEQLMPFAPSGVEKEQIEMAMRDLRAQLAAFTRRHLRSSGQDHRECRFGVGGIAK
jgi:hypothetical protein